MSVVWLFVVVATLPVPHMMLHPSFPSPSAELSPASFLLSFISLSAFRSRRGSAPFVPPPTTDELDRKRCAARLSPASAASRYQMRASCGDGTVPMPT